MVKHLRALRPARRGAIVQQGDPVLSATAAPISDGEFKTKEFSALLQDMMNALEGERDGVAIAAPQIGVGKRIFLVRYDRLLPVSSTEEAPRRAEIGVYVNPKIIKTSRKRSVMDEGCLSTRGTYGTTTRFERATVEAQDEQGKLFTRGGGGILAQIFQHEIDHLDGILFTDHATDIYDAHHDSDA